MGFPGALGRGGSARPKGYFLGLAAVLGAVGGHVGQPRGGQLRERSRQHVAADLLASDFDTLEEGLVQEAALGVVGLEVGGLDVVREVERSVERADDSVLLDLVTPE